MKLENGSLAIGMVLYNEGVNVTERIRNLASCGTILYVYDNSPESTYARRFLEAEHSDKIRYFTLGKNAGLGVAMSTLCAQAYYDGHNRLLFLDQDTVISAETISFVKFMTVNLEKYSGISIVSNNQIAGGFLDTCTDLNISHVKLVRNSGTIFNLYNLCAMDWFDTSFFVDGVDYAFSFRSTLNGFLLGSIGNVPGFDHLSEQGYSNYAFFGRKIFYRRYEASRVADVIRSSFKLIHMSVVKLRFDYAYLYVKLLLAFLFLQCILRVSRRIE